jgi:hypothetical protein
MKTFGVCAECGFYIESSSNNILAVDYFDDGIAIFECSVGHKTAQVMQHQKFEMLLNSGAMALLDGYTLEACASFAAALERFYEFSLRVTFLGRKIPSELYPAMFSEMARQSERQLGAFMLLHALEFGSAYIQNPNIATFRNGVIHKGMIPTFEQARSFCSHVYETIYNIFNSLHAKYADAIHGVVREDFDGRFGKVPPDAKVSASSGGNLFSIPLEPKFSSFSDALDSFKKHRDQLKGLLQR